MPEAHFRFYGELNDFLPPEMRQRTLAYPFNNRQSVKHLIEAAGIPHTEIDLILADGESVPFDYLVGDGKRIAVFPAFHEVDVSPIAMLRPPVPSPARFVLDNHLGRLARYLRLLGFDTRYPREHLDDAELAQIAHDDGRIMLTRDRGLLMRSIITYGYCLRSKDTMEQLTAVLNRFRLQADIQPWRRCLRCNGTLRPIAKEEILQRLEPKTKLYYHEFRICQQCQQIYWKGSHYEKLERLILKVSETA